MAIKAQLDKLDELSAAQTANDLVIREVRYRLHDLRRDAILEKGLLAGVWTQYRPLPPIFARSSWDNRSDIHSLVHPRKGQYTITLEEDIYLEIYTDYPCLRFFTADVDRIEEFITKHDIHLSLGNCKIKAPHNAHDLRKILILFE